MYIAILGRQPAISIAELERLYGNAEWFSGHAALVDTDSIDIERLGGTQKAGRVVFELPNGDWRRVSTKIVQTYAKQWAASTGKITLGISAYDFSASPRDIQKTGLILKAKLKDSGVSLRLIPNTELILNTATSHHNKLGLSDNKIELLAVRNRDGRIVVAESVGAQNITALATRDQGRPKRDAFVGMLPPKLAQIMINLAVDGAIESANPLRQTMSSPDGDDAGSLSQGAGAPSSSSAPIVLDPFCGTGVVLQEAALMGYSVYGTDLADKMIDYSHINLDWLKQNYHLSTSVTLTQGDATTTTWRQPIDAVVAETYLGQPFSAPPSPAKLTEVRGNCNHIISEFLTNIGSQLQPGTPLCLAIPAWRDKEGGFTHLPLIRDLDKLGYSRIQLQTVTPDQLLYYREDQVVARELLILKKA